MTKIRLTQSARDDLRSLAKKLVLAEPEAKAVEKAYKALAPIMRKMIEAKYPPRDMRVLKKYEKAEIDDCIRVQLASGGVQKFDFESGTGPLSACPYCNTYPLDAKQTDLFDEWLMAVQKHNEAIDKKLSDYRGLIIASRTWEDVIDVWPEAKTIKPEFANYPLSILSADVIERIKADVSTREAA